jgi:hypothetical protein
MKNKVLESTRILLQDPKYVNIDEKAIDKLGEKFSKEELKIPTWDLPVMLEGKTKEVIDFFLLGDSINFAYIDPATKVKYATNYAGIDWRGAMGMWASLKKAHENKIPILEGEYLVGITIKEMQKIFTGNIPMPMLEERTAIFQEMGQILLKKYGSHFYNLVEASNNRLFNNGTGMVERLIQDFPSFDDSTVYGNQVIRFDKRAQLGPATLYGRFENKGLFQVNDIEELTIFADYEIPKVLRHFGALIYENSLAKKVDTQEPILKNSKEELEIRASTIHASMKLIDKVNEYRKKQNEKVNALHLDYKLWSESRNIKAPPHITTTIAY